MESSSAEKKGHNFKGLHGIGGPGLHCTEKKILGVLPWKNAAPVF